MSSRPSVEEQQLLADSFDRASSRMSRRELIVELLAGVGFVAAVSALWLVAPPHGFSVAAAVVCWVMFLLATMVRFETPFGFTVPTQLAFVPLVFALPVALVPIAVALAMVVRRLLDIFRGGLEPARLARAAGVTGWFAIGPAAVFALLHVAPRHASPEVLVGALMAQFVVDFTVSGLLLTLERHASFLAQLRDWWVYGVDAALACVGLVIADEMQRSVFAGLSALPLLGVMASFARERHQRLESLVELNNAYRGTALVLGDVVEADDGYTGEHCKSVVALCIDVGERLGLSAERQRNLEFGALLHDVGKIAIPKEIINKPGKLDPAEWTIIKTHTLEGQRMLDRVGGFMREVGRIVRSHHERWDGQGYPDSLAGEAIALEARIIAACDTWNAMRTDRAYRSALSFEVAMEELRRCSGSQLDPGIVEALIEVVTPEVKPVIVASKERAPVVGPAPASAT